VQEAGGEEPGNRAEQARTSSSKRHATGNRDRPPLLSLFFIGGIHPRGIRAQECRCAESGP
jgi:hypothetical protein